MKKITSLDQLEYARGDLFVKVVCPNCENVLISLMEDAEDILTRGTCAICDNYSNLCQIHIKKDKLSQITLLGEAEVISE